MERNQDDTENTGSVCPEHALELPALVHLRGTLLLPGQEYYPSAESPLKESILHTVPVNHEYLVVHTRSSVTLYHLPTQTILWHIPCFSFNFALDCQQNLLTLTPEAQDGSIVVWNVRTGQLLHQLSYTGGDFFYHVCPGGLTFSPNGQLLAVGVESAEKEETRVVLWDMTDGNLFGTLETGDYDDITTLAFHPTRNLLVGGSFNNQKVWFWSLDDGRLLNVWEPKCNDRTYDLEFNPDGTLLFVAWGNGGLRVWDMKQQREVPGSGNNLYPTDVTVAPDGQSLAVAHFGGVRHQDVRVLEIGSWRLLRTFAGNDPSESYSPDGKILTTSEEHGHVYVWEVATQQLLYTL